MTKKRLIILGAGSSGVLAANYFCAWLEQDWEIKLIHNPQKPILGIGESTNPSFIEALELGSNFKVHEDLKQLDGTIKLGTKYVGWRAESFVNPLLGGSMAAHIDTYSLKEFSLPRLEARWEGKFKVVEQEVLGAQSLEDCASVTLGNGEVEYCSYIIDCRGAPSKHDPEVVHLDAILDSCIVYQDTDSSNDPGMVTYTGHTATEHGWMFTVPLQSRNSYGYMYNSTISSFDEALQGLRSTVPKACAENVIEFHFSPYYARKVLKGRILRNGNSALFFEPMFANSLWAYDNINKNFHSFLLGGINEEEVNLRHLSNAVSIRSAIALHYIGGSTMYNNHPFWDLAAADSKRALGTLEGVEFTKRVVSAVEGSKALKGFQGVKHPGVFNTIAWVNILNNLGYNTKEIV